MTNCAGRCWRSDFVFCPRLGLAGFGASWGRACVFGLDRPLGVWFFVFPRLWLAGFGASWGRACAFGLGRSCWVSARTVPLVVWFFVSSRLGLAGFGASWGRACAFGLGRSRWVSARTVPLGVLVLRLFAPWARGFWCVLGTGLCFRTGVVSSGFLPGPSPLGFVGLCCSSLSRFATRRGSGG